MNNNPQSIVETLKPVTFHCPTCGQDTKASLSCRRCGSDLTLLFTTYTEAWQFRTRARQCLLQGEFAKALQLAQKAQKIHHTPVGAFVLLLTQATTASSQISKSPCTIEHPDSTPER
jgi:hypothetical protein